VSLTQLRRLDPPTGRVIRRIETSRPGELVHIDLKKLGRIPDGGGWWTHGRGNDADKGHSHVGYDFIHSAVDAYSRVAYSEILNTEDAVRCTGFPEEPHPYLAHASRLAGWQSCALQEARPAGERSLRLGVLRTTRVTDTSHLHGEGD
jgi:hypothetical protein